MMELHELHEHVKPQLKKEKRPKGVYVLTAWFCWNLVSTLFGFLNPMLVIGGKIITGTPVVFLYLSLTLIISYKIYGFLTKKKWSQYLIIGHELFSLLYMFVGTILFYVNKEESVAAMDRISGGATAMFGPQFYDIVFLITFTLYVIFSSLIIYYVITRRNYFTE